MLSLLEVKVMVMVEAEVEKGTLNRIRTRRKQKVFSGSVSKAESIDDPDCDYPPDGFSIIC
jgi:hypothetical protein